MWELISKYFNIYLIWSIVYLPLNIYNYIKSDNSNIFIFFLRLIKNFFITGSYFHFWFFPALIFAITLTYLLEKYKINKKLIIGISLLLYVLGCLGCSYAKLFDGFPTFILLFKSNLFNVVRRVPLMAFPFFINGYWVYYIWKKHQTFFINNGSKLVKTLFLLLIVYLLEIYLVSKLNLYINIVITVMLYPLLMIVLFCLLIFKLSGNQALAEKCRSLANFTYYSHPLFIILINFVAKQVFACKAPQTLLFALVCLFTMVTGLTIDYFKTRCKQQ